MKVPQEYIDLYLAKAKEIPFSHADVKTQKGQREAVRYLLVNGLIPVTKENLDLVGKKEFYISAEHLPDHVKKVVEESAMLNIQDWEYDEEFEDDELKVIATKVEGAWIKQGKVTNAKMEQQREIRVSTTYHTPKLGIKIP